MINVLVVDDHAQVNKSLCKVIRAEGHRAISVASGEDALALLAADRPDLVILDISMPGMSGIDVLRVLRADPLTAALPIVMFSAKADTALRQQALELGANDYWIKGETDPALFCRILEKLVRTPAPAQQ